MESNVVKQTANKSDDKSNNADDQDRETTKVPTTVDESCSKPKVKSQEDHNKQDEVARKSRIPDDVARKANEDGKSLDNQWKAIDDLKER